MYAENIDDCPLRLRVDTECMVARSAVIKLPGAAVTHGLSVKSASHNNITTPRSSCCSSKLQKTDSAGNFKKFQAHSFGDNRSFGMI